MSSDRLSYMAGRHGHKVEVYERSDQTNLYVSVWEDGREVKRSLEHADREKAKDYADDLSGELRRGEVERVAADETPTVARVFRLYLKHRSPDTGEYSRKADQRHAACWKRFLGAGFDLSKLSRRQWDRFLRQRRSGAIDARGKPVPEAKREPVGAHRLRQGRHAAPERGVEGGPGTAGGELVARISPVVGLQPKEPA